MVIAVKSSADRKVEMPSDSMIIQNATPLPGFFEFEVASSAVGVSAEVCGKLSCFSLPSRECTRAGVAIGVGPSRLCASLEDMAGLSLLFVDKDRSRILSRGQVEPAVCRKK